ncbi:hypothetical protein [Pedobacter caeni]|uniref:Outer membrane protein beta-barrel domain-containing protein n=1 Tax=Pedobacter caeni TaxID=288992 RepID=A0A1M4Z3H4_9SPHI|nr:hypothetical protein [Pedobacter caeni]SHF12357.1 hypothetical protein SAMN04488522_102165 [Pedobacter caeni]
MRNLQKQIYSIALFFLFFVITQKSIAQDTVTIAKPLQSLNKIKLIIPGIFFEHEHLISPSTTVYGGIGIGAGVAYSYSNWGGSNWAFSMSPTAYLGLRNYYNLEKRAKKGRQTRNNAANFFGVEIGGSTKAIVEKNTYGNDGGMALDIFWGIQRSLGRKINFEMQLGPSLGTDFEEFKLHTVSGKIGFSYIL